MAKQDKMIEAQKELSREKVRYAIEVIDTMRENGETITAYTLQKKSRLSKSFIYNNEEVMEYLNRYRSEKKYNYKSYTPEDAKEELIEKLEKENAMLRKELTFYKNANLKSLMDENQILKHRLAKYEKLIKDGIIQISEDTE